MPLDANGQWYPRLSPKQIEAYNDNRRHILLSGPRISGKTIVAIHKAIRHAWLHKNDRVGLFVRSTKVGRLGLWDDLITYALPEWCGDGDPDAPDYDPGLKEQGFKITFGPAVDGATRMTYVKIANRWGGESTLELHSLHHDDDVSEKLKGTRFGLLLWDELDLYDSADVFNVSVLQLRQIGLDPEKHMWLATTNPAGDENHWIYQKFWVEPKDESFDKKYRDSLAVHEFKLTDNIYLKETDVTVLKMTYKNDSDMYQRYVEGKWCPDIKKTHFAGVFSLARHVKGDLIEGTGLMPTEGCVELYTGWDLGDRNNAVIFLEHVTTGGGDYWAVLDEIVHVAQDIPLRDIVDEVAERLEEIATLHGKPIIFKHWSDRSAFDRYRSAADAADHILVYNFSGGKIELQGCPKPPNSVDARLALVRKLLIENKLYVSANCTYVIDMFKRLAKGKTKTEKIKRDTRGAIHTFDALSYALYAELIETIEDAIRPRVVNLPAAFALT